MSLKKRPLALLASFVALGAIGAACADLPAIASNQCGNRIVEAPEDCDTFANANGACRAPGTTGACRFDCTGNHFCPPTYTCGKVDGICRQATGTFDVASAQTVFADATVIGFGDFDGDGRADAVTGGVSDMRIHFFDDNMSLAKTLILPLPTAKFHITGLGSDTNADLSIVRQAGTIDVFRGQSDRSVTPVIYNAVPVPNTTTTARAILVRNQASNPIGDDILAFASTDKGIAGVLDLGGRKGTAATGSGPPAATTVIALPAGTVSNVAGTVPVGSFIEASMCDQYVLAFNGDGGVDVHTPCRPKGGTYVLNTILDANSNSDANYLPPTRVTLPIGATVGVTSGSTNAGAFVVDVNGDGHRDLVIAASLAGVAGVYVAYGIGDGTFSSLPALAPVDNAATLYPSIDFPGLSAKGFNVAPLAIADLNGDKAIDFVTGNGIYFSSTGKYIEGASELIQSPWSEAVIADVNRDGILDVAAANPNGAIDFFLGNGTSAMSALSYALDGTPKNLVVGDFDGDLTLDLAFAVEGVDSGNDIDVLYGQAFAFPAQPTSLGSLSTVLQLAAAPLAATYTGVTAPTNGAVSSMVALNSDSSSNVFAAILVGNPNRVVTSSFELFVSLTQRASAVRATAGNFVAPSAHDMMVLAQDASNANMYELWLLPSTGEAALDSTTLKVGPPLPANFNWAGAPIYDVPLDSTGIESVIALAAPTTPGAVQLFVIDPNTFAISAGIPLGGCVFANGSLSLQARTSDFDGDGFRDVLTSCPDVSGKTMLTVFWGNGTTSLDASRSTSVPLPPDPVVIPTDYRVGPVVSRSIAMLTANGVYLSTPGGADGRTLSPATQDSSLPGGTFLNAADMDGDGVADLVIANAPTAQVQFFRGIPVNSAPVTP